MQSRTMVARHADSFGSTVHSSHVAHRASRTNAAAGSPDSDRVIAVAAQPVGARDRDDRRVRIEARRSTPLAAATFSINDSAEHGAVPNTCANASTTLHSLSHQPGFASRCTTVARSKATVSHTGIGSNEAATRGASLHRQNRQIAIAACQPGDTGNTTRIAARRPTRIEMRAAPNDASPLHCRAR